MDSANYILVEKYTDSMMTLPARFDNSPADSSLKLWHNNQHKLACYYAPFDHVNCDADIIIVGITPGRTQMNRSLNAFQHAVAEGFDNEQALQRVKQNASLSGAMRPTIIKILNKLGYAKKLDIACCRSLWAEDNHRVHFCSLLKYPVFINQKDYSGQVAVERSPELNKLLYQGFVSDLKHINPNAIIVPLGEMVASVIATLVGKGDIAQKPLYLQDKVVAPPHPSGANAESIALLLEDPFPDLASYQQRMYQSYCYKHRNNNSQPRQDEQRYKKARAARWQAISLLRQAYKV